MHSIFEKYSEVSTDAECSGAGSYVCFQNSTCHNHGLHWLTVCLWVQNQVLVLIFEALHSMWPGYLRDCLALITSAHPIRPGREVMMQFFGSWCILEGDQWSRNMKSINWINKYINKSMFGGSQEVGLLWCGIYLMELFPSEVRLAPSLMFRRSLKTWLWHQAGGGCPRTGLFNPWHVYHLWYFVTWQVVRDC